MLTELLPAEIFAILLVFLRVGAAFMLLPGLGEPYVPTRVRLLLALLVAFVVTPVLRAGLPPLPESAWQLALLVLGEVVIGVFLGTVARMFMAALTTAGMMIATMSAMANALVNDPSAAQQGSIAGSFLTLVALLVIFALDLHHLMLQAVIESYGLFAPGAPLPVGDFAEVIASTFAKTFLLAFQLAAPFVAVGMVFYLGIGALSRLMPQIQVFFIAMPVQIMLGLSIMSLVLPALMLWFAGNLESAVRPYAGG